MRTRTLTTHSAIRNWVESRKGHPALGLVRDRIGQLRPRLSLNFQHPELSDVSPSVDDGVSPCSWNAWLAELDRQNLALKVSDTASGVEFVERGAMH